MAQSSSLTALVNLTQERLDEAARALGTAQSEFTAAQAQLDKLEQYKVAYSQRCASEMVSGIQAALLQNYQAFINSLAAGVIAQGSVVEASRLALDSAKAEWAECNQKLASYKVLVQRAEQQQALKASRLEQKQNDEFAARAFRLGSPWTAAA